VSIAAHILSRTRQVLNADRHCAVLSRASTLDSKLDVAVGVVFGWLEPTVTVNRHCDQQERHKRNRSIKDIRIWVLIPNICGLSLRVFVSVLILVGG